MAHTAFRLARHRFQRIQPLRRNGLARLQAARAHQLIARIVQKRAGLIKLRRNSAGIEFHQGFPRLDLLTFGEADMRDNANNLAGDGDSFARAHRADAFNLIHHHAATYWLHHNANGARWSTARGALAGG